MVLTLTFILLVSAFALALWGTSLFFQSYLYSEPAGHMPIRAVVAGLLVGGFLTLWTVVNTRADSTNKYGTFFDFNPVGAKEVTTFDAVRHDPRKMDGPEEVTAFTRKEGIKPPVFVDASGNPYQLVDKNKGRLTTALLVDVDGQKVRLNARMNPKKPSEYRPAGDVGDHQFDEDRGARYVDGAYPYTVYAPSRGATITTLALNALMFAAWFVAFWLVLQYGSGHALGFAFVCGTATLVVLMPLLFKLNTPKPTPPTPPAAVAVA